MLRCLSKSWYNISPPQRSSWDSTSWHIFSKVCSLMSWMADLLLNSQSWICDKISAHQDQKTSSVSTKYLPLNFIIFGSCIHWNSLNIWATAAAETSATIVAASWGLLVSGAILLTSNVQLSRFAWGTPE